MKKSTANRKRARRRSFETLPSDLGALAQGESVIVPLRVTFFLGDRPYARFKLSDGTESEPVALPSNVMCLGWYNWNGNEPTS